MEHGLAQVGEWDRRTQNEKEWNVKKTPAKKKVHQAPSLFRAVFSLHEGHTLANKL